MVTNFNHSNNWSNHQNIIICEFENKSGTYKFIAAPKEALNINIIKVSSIFINISILKFSIKIVEIKNERIINIIKHTFLINKLMLIAITKIH